MELGRYKLWVRPHNRKPEEKADVWHSFKSMDYKGEQYQIDSMRRRILEKYYHNQYKVARFYDEATNREICRFANGVMVTERDI
jgi:hypothetical protein